MGKSRKTVDVPITRDLAKTLALKDPSLKATYHNKKAKKGNSIEYVFLILFINYGLTGLVMGHSVVHLVIAMPFIVWLIYRICMKRRSWKHAKRVLFWKVRNVPYEDEFYIYDTVSVLVRPGIKVPDGATKAKVRCMVKQDTLLVLTNEEGQAFASNKASLQHQEGLKGRFSGFNLRGGYKDMVASFSTRVLFDRQVVHEPVLVTLRAVTNVPAAKAEIVSAEILFYDKEGNPLQ